MQSTQNLKIDSSNKQYAEERIHFLEQKNEALLLENSYLREQNSKFKGEVEMLTRVNESLKETLSFINLNEATRVPRRKSSMNIKLPLPSDNPILSRFESFSESSRFDEASTNTNKEQAAEMAFEMWSNDKTDSKIHNITVDTFKPDFTMKTAINDLSISDTSSTPSTVLDPKRLVEINERYAKSMELNNISDLEKLLNGVLDNPEWFYKINNVMRLPKPSPYSKQKVTQIEKRLDETENILKKWTRALKQVNMACTGYMKSIEAFTSQLVSDKDFFEENKEMHHLVVLVAQFLKENAVYLEVFIKVVNNSIYNPLKSFYKDILPTYKDLKKKVTKAYEEMETAEGKYLSLKKSAIHKDPFCGQAPLKTYMTSLRNFQLVRIDYIRTLNDINLNFNIEFVDKMCAIFSSKMAYLNSSYDVVVGLEGQIQTYINGTTRKSEICNGLSEEFRKLRDEIERNIFVNYPATLTPNAIKEGYLYVRFETKEFKRRFCLIQENGMLCWVKEPEGSSATEEPQIKEMADIKFCKVKESTEYDLIYCFELVSAMVKKPIILQADSETTMQEWISSIQRHTETVLFRTPSSEANTSLQRRNSSSDIPSPGEPKSLNLDTKESKFKKAASSKNTLTDSAKQTLISQIIEENLCADCNTKAPSWLSLNLGTIICIECSGVHRRLGPNVSKVRSLKLDNLSLTVLELFAKLNTKDVNRVWEGAMDQAPSMKPDHESDQERREAFIRNKYMEKVFLKPVKEEDHIKALCDALLEKDLMKVLNIIAYTTKDLNGLYEINEKKRGILHYAAANSSKHIVELLIRNGCQIDLYDQDHFKPLDHSMLGHNVEVMEYLVNKIEENER